MKSAQGLARPRAGLLGNPSDLYGGAVIAFTFDDFATRVSLAPAAERELLPAAGAQLLAAAVARFAARFPELELGAGERLRARLAFETDVPRQAGLSGSSAIVIAALRALIAAFDVSLAPFEVAELALAAEVEDLGIVAGPQDRVVQAYGGLVAMDFARPRAPEHYSHLDPALLPPLLIAWNPAPGRDSGATHHDVFERWRAGDPAVRDAMAAYPSLVARGLAALRAGDVDALADAVDENFDRRAELFPIAAEDRALVELGRGHGAASKFCGSGGAVLCVPRAGVSLESLENVYRAAGASVLRPRVSSAP